MYEHVLTQNDGNKELIVVHDNMFMLGDYVHPPVYNYYISNKVYISCSVQTPNVLIKTYQTLYPGLYYQVGSTNNYYYILSVTTEGSGSFNSENFVSYSGC